MGFPGYFLIVSDYIRAAREELGVSVGPGRGSAAGSVVAYCLWITDLDPLKYDLLFERFLNPDRISLPDIDVDFDDAGRGKVLDWITQKYGKEKVAHIITYGTMATKSAIADVGRVEKVPLSTVNQLKSYIPDRGFPDNIKDEKGKSPKVNLKNCYKYVPELKAIMQGEEGPEAAEYADLCRRAGGHQPPGGHPRLRRHHRCRRPDQHRPRVHHRRQGVGRDVLVTQYDGHVVETVGLIKMDFLGLKNLTIIKNAIRMIKKNHGVDIDIDHIPIDDELTYKLFCDGNTVGTFQFESAGMQKYLRELQPHVFEDLIAMNALYRPGPMDYIPDFIDRKQGRKPIEYDIPVMEKYLKDTYGITVYQEQVMLLSRLLAGFTRGQSDTLRKAMGKKQIDKMNELEVLFYEGGEKNGHPKEKLNKIWEDWKKFASYAFNKSHAACYSWVAYQTAYLKAHYPAEYMAAVMTSAQTDIKRVTELMDDCRKHGHRDGARRSMSRRRTSRSTATARYASDCRPSAAWARRPPRRSSPSARRTAPSRTSSTSSSASTCTPSTRRTWRCWSRPVPSTAWGRCTARSISTRRTSWRPRPRTSTCWCGGPYAARTAPPPTRCPSSA